MSERLARDLQAAFPGMTGFSTRNVWRMRSFYLAYTEEARKLPRPVAEMDGEGLPRHLVESLPPEGTLPSPEEWAEELKHAEGAPKPEGGDE